MNAPKKIEKNSIQAWIQGAKIRDLKNVEPIKEQLRRVFALVGCTPPKNELKDLLLGYIHSNYGHLNPLEIGKAWELALQGKYQVDLKHYNNFTAEYFSRVINAYLEYRGKELTRPGAVKKIALPEPKFNRLEYYEENLFKPYDQLLEGGSYSFSELDEKFLYRSLEALGIVLMSLEDKKSLFQQQTKGKKFNRRKSKEKQLEEIKTYCQQLAFRNWIHDKALNEEDIRQLIKPLIK